MNLTHPLDMLDAWDRGRGGGWGVREGEENEEHSHMEASAFHTDSKVTYKKHTENQLHRFPFCTDEQV